MLFAVFNDIGNIYMINSILGKHKYHQIPQIHALTSGKKAMWKIIIMNLLKHIYIVAAHLQYIIMLKIYAQVSNLNRSCFICPFSVQLRI